MDTGSQPGPSISIGGDVRGQNVVIGSTQTVHGDLSIAVGSLPAASEDTRRAMQEQIARLLEALEQVPTDRKDDVEDLHMALQDAVSEADKDQPDSDGLKKRSRALKRAAERVADVAPAVLGFATQVAATIAAIG